MRDPVTRATHHESTERCTAPADPGVPPEHAGDAFPHLLLEALRGSPGTPAFEQGARIVSRGELLELIGRMAGANPFLMAGYWGQPEETRDVLRDGWLRTLDLGHLDETGLLHLAGRTRDVIMVNAIVVYAGPIERALAGHPDVAEAYVAGAPDERTGEAVHAFVVPAPGRTPDHAALTELVRAELGADSVPGTITTVSSVPVAPSGKPDKRALLERHLSSAL
ncbi:class I adenylate-forming enzyme family protein [Microbispora siamensis]